MVARKYHGTLLHCSHDAEGIIEVVDDRYTRSLHFGTSARQSALFPSEPKRLALSYTRAMAAGLLLIEDPKKVLLIGVGGGSLATFLLHHFPCCQVDALERRAEVVAVAKTYFHLPDDEPRLHIHIVDGVAFAHEASLNRYGNYDLILCDAYHAHGIEQGAAEYGFIAACQARLTATGALVANLWGGEYGEYRRALHALTKCYGHRPLQLPVADTTNVILYGVQCMAPRLLWKPLEARARALEAATGLEYLRLMRALRRHNE